MANAVLIRAILDYFKNWQNVLMLVVTILYVALIFTTIIDVSVADGNGILSLGAIGYCLYLPDKDCFFLFPVKIGQSFFQP